MSNAEPIGGLAHKPDRGGRSRKLLTYATGLALVLLAVVWIVVLHRGEFVDAIGRASEAPPLLLASLLVLPVLNWFIVSMSFWVLTVRFGRVDAPEMGALIGSAWLLNYLPMRPGLVGRIAYHKKVNDIRVRDSVRVLIESMSLTFAAIACLIIAAIVVRFTGVESAATIVVGGIGLLTIVGAVVFASAGSVWWRFCAAFALRIADMLIWSARYAVVFAVVGHPIEFGQAVAIAAVSQIAIAVPISGNGLGLREWMVALTAGALPAWYVGESGFGASEAAVGMTADLINRAAELVVAGVIGSVSIAALTRRTAAHASDCDAAEERLPANQPPHEPAQQHEPGQTGDDQPGEP